MTKKEKQILFEATEEAWKFLKIFKEDKDESSQALYRTYRKEFTTLSDLCDKLGLREEYIKYAAQQRNNKEEI